jgi:hypothetical protein
MLCVTRIPRIIRGEDPFYFEQDGYELGWPLPEPGSHRAALQPGHRQEVPHLHHLRPLRHDDRRHANPSTEFLGIILFLQQSHWV